jgi:tRNA (guanine37-N1)-methyltransferase
MAMKLKKLLADSLSPKELQYLVGGYDVVGDIAIVIVPEPLTSREQIIAEAILASNKKIKVVAKRAGNYGGEFRTMPLQILAGENRKETEVKEYGVRLLVNPEAVYYSVRSGSERRRIASLVTPGESVLVLFSGIAPFPLIISRYSQAGSIVGIEKNPRAYDYAVLNLRRNKKQQNIQLFPGDVREVVPVLKDTYDRVIMPLPTRGEEFLPYALSVLKTGGYLHFYDMQRQELFDHSVEKIVNASAALDRRVLSSTLTKCGHCAPDIYRICVDTRIS